MYPFYRTESLLGGSHAHAHAHVSLMGAMLMMPHPHPRGEMLPRPRRRGVDLRGQDVSSFPSPHPHVPRTCQDGFPETVCVFARATGHSETA